MPQKVTDPDLLAALNGNAPPAQAGPVLGPPILPKEPKPYEPPSGYTGGPESLAPIPGGPADPNKPKEEPNPIEGDKKAASFLIRALGANAGFEDTGEGGRSIFAQSFQDFAPNLSNTLVNSGPRQVADTAQKEFIAAVLRLDSGAAIPLEEEENYKRLYFPQPGDGEDVLKYKQQARIRAIEGLRLSAGPLADEAQARFDKLYEQFKSGAAGNDEQGLTGGVTYEGPNPANNRTEPPAPNGTDSDGNSFLGSVGDIVEGAATIPGLVVNPVGQALYDVTGYGDAKYDLGTILRTGLGLPRNPDGLLRNVNTFASSALSGGLGARAAATLPKVGSIASGVLNTLGRTPIRDTVAGAGAGAGAYYGERVAGPVGGVLGGLAGGMAGYGGAGALSRQALPRQANAVAAGLRDAGQAEGVTVNRAMVDPKVANTFSGVEATRAGGPRINREMNRIEGQIEGRVQDLGRGGQAMDDIATGDTVRNAGERFIDRSGKIAKRKYDRAEQLAGDTKVQPKEALQAVDGMIASLSETPSTNQAEINFLSTIKNDLGKDLSVGALRRMRTQLRQRISKGELTFGEDEARVLSIMDAAADDIRAGLTKAGKPDAAQAFDAADKAYRARMEYINGTVQKLLGKRQASLSAEQVAGKFRSMASNDARGLRKFYATLEPEEAADVAATFAERLGQNNKGEFSPAIFLNQTEKMSGQTAQTLFGPEGAKSLRNLRTLAKEVNRLNAMRNRSNTGRVNNYREFLWNALLGGGGVGAGAGLLSGSGTTGAMTAIGTGAAIGGVQGARNLLNARMLMSPKITRWLSQAPATASPQAINAHFGRLAAIAKTEPALASEIQALQAKIMQVANDNASQVGAAAASPDKENNANQ